MILPIIRSSLVVLVLTFVIATSSVVGTGYAKKVTSSIFSESESESESEAVQALDANQNIIQRIASLQQQINELRQQVQRIPQGPPGPPGPPGETKDLVSEVVTVTADTLDVSRQFREGTAHCPEGKVITGGGFEMRGDIEPLFFYYNGPGPGQSWLVKAFGGQDEPGQERFFNVFAVCAGLE